MGWLILKGMVLRSSLPSTLADMKSFHYCRSFPRWFATPSSKSKFPFTNFPSVSIRENSFVTFNLVQQSDAVCENHLILLNRYFITYLLLYTCILSLGKYLRFNRVICSTNKRYKRRIVIYRIILLTRHVILLQHDNYVPVKCRVTMSFHTELIVSTMKD